MLADVRLQETDAVDAIELSPNDHIIVTEIEKRK